MIAFGYQEYPASIAKEELEPIFIAVKEKIPTITQKTQYLEGVLTGERCIVPLDFFALLVKGFLISTSGEASAVPGSLRFLLGFFAPVPAESGVAWMSSPGEV